MTRQPAALAARPRLRKWEAKNQSSVRRKTMVGWREFMKEGLHF
jgi:hypothetical protein